MARLDLRLNAKEKEALRRTARYFGFSMTDLIKKWIVYGGPEGLLKEWKNKFT